MLPVSKSPLGYRNLLTWKQANQIFELTEQTATTLPRKHPLTDQYLTDLKDQMIRSARSVVRNIEEGYARNSTREYVDFLGFSIASLEELLQDYGYCEKGNLGDVQKVNEGIKLCRGESKMLRNQIAALGEKQIKERTFSKNDQARLILNRQAEINKSENQWLEEVKEKYLKKDKNK